MPFPPPKQDEASHGDMKPNSSHDGNHGAHNPNGHHTPAKQAEHQKSLDQNHGAGRGDSYSSDPQEGGE